MTSEARSGGSGDEAVAPAGDRADEPRGTPIVLELHAQVPDMPVDEIALRGVVRAPERIEDRPALERRSGVRREEIQQRLLGLGEVHPFAVRPNGPLEEVDVEAGDLDGRN